MSAEVIERRPGLRIQRQRLAPGEATPWHTDACHRVTIVASGERLRIEFADGASPVEVDVRPGRVDRDAPEPRAHRAVNVGSCVYEEVVVFLLEPPGVEPQPEAAGPASS